MNDGAKPLVSLIIPVKNEGDYLRSTLESAIAAKTGFPTEILVVDDGSSDGCCEAVNTPDLAERVKIIETQGIGLARAKNLGAEHSRGEYLIFCDAHLLFEDLWIDNLLEPVAAGLADGTTPGIAVMNRPDVIGYGQTLNSMLKVEWNVRQETPFPCAVAPGGCFAVSGNVFREIGGFDGGFRGWGYEDVELSIKMWLFGYRCFVQPQVKVLHLFREAFPYHVSSEEIDFNMLRMAYSHFNERRIEACKQLILTEDPSRIENLVLRSGVLQRRSACFLRRLYDDDWYMEKFGILF